MTASPAAPRPSRRARRDRTHWLYIGVVVAVGLGIAVGLIFGEKAIALQPLGDGFVALITMMIQPVIFCTIVLGVGSVARAAQVGKVGGLALGYFLVMSTFALTIGLVVGNLVKPGEGLEVSRSLASEGRAEAKGSGSTVDFVLGIIPDSLFSSLTSGDILQTLFVALLVGFAVQAMGTTGKPVLVVVEYLQRVVFRVLAMILWAAPVGAFGAMAAFVGDVGTEGILSLVTVMLAFYATCALFVFVVLGLLLKTVAGINIFSLFRYLAREFLLILSTSSSESALPRLIAKMEHAGVDKTTVGIVVPTGYSFNLDGTAIYLTMASLFIAEALGDPLSIGEQISLLVFMVIASKGAAGVTGRRARDPGGRAVVAPSRAARRRRARRRHRPVHVRGARADQLRGQLGRHRAHRDVDRRRGPRAAGRGARRGAAVRRDDDARRDPRGRRRGRRGRRSWRRPARPPAGRLTA